MIGAIANRLMAPIPGLNASQKLAYCAALMPEQAHAAEPGALDLTWGNCERKASSHCSRGCGQLLRERPVCDRYSALRLVMRHL